MWGIHRWRRLMCQSVVVAETRVVSELTCSEKKKNGTVPAYSHALERRSGPRYLHPGVATAAFDRRV